MLAGVLVVVLVAAGVAVWRTTRPDRAGPVPAGVGEVFSDLPAQLGPPTAVVDLPTDRGVGSAALIYHRDTDVDSYDEVSGTFAQDDVYLVTRSGEHFRIGRTPRDPGSLGMSLSPDGRWLGAKRDGRWRVRDLSGIAEYEVPDGYELWLWSTDAGSLLLAKVGAEGRALATMPLPGGGVRPLRGRTSKLGIEVAFIAGRELVVYEPNVTADPSGQEKVGVTVEDIVSGVRRTVPVVASGQLRPGEVAGPVLVPWHVGGSPTTIWAEIDRLDPRSTEAPQRVLSAPPVALVGVDLASGAAVGRIEADPASTADFQQCRGVVADGVVLQRWSDAKTELLVVDPRRHTRRVVTTFPQEVTVLVPGAPAWLP